MNFAFALPLIGQYSLYTQLTLLTLLTISLLHPRFRPFTLALLGLYTAAKILIPLVRWAVYVFKAIALFGFYVHYFQVAIGFAITAYAFCANFEERMRGLLGEADATD